MFWRLTCAFVSGWLFLAPPAESGLRYHAQVELPVSLSANVWVEGVGARVEIQTSEEPNLVAGTVLLTSDGGERFFVLAPAQQEYFSLPHEVIARFKRRDAERRHITSDPISSEKLVEDAGPVLAGYPTRHLRFQIRMATHQPTPSGEVTTQIEVFEHFWLTEEIPQRNTDLAILADSSGTGLPTLDEFLRGQLRELSGFVLKRNLVLTVDDSLGNHHVLRMGYEVTELAAADAPAALFQIPENFHMRVPQRGQSAPAATPPSQP